METLQIEFQPNIKAQLLEFLNSFSKNDLKIVEEEIEIVHDEAFLGHKKRLHESFRKLENGETRIYDIDELDALLDKTISEYEN